MTFDKPLVAPLVNNNGDPALTLINQLIDIRSALFTTMGKMRAASTHHGRNFQTVPNARVVQREANDAWKILGSTAAATLLPPALHQRVD